MKFIKNIFTLTSILMLFACSTTEKTRIMDDAAILPEFDLPVPQVKAEQEYLGVSGNRLFRVQQIKADVVIIKLFSVHCPLCHKDAPKLNRLYRDIESNAALKGRLKIIAIGGGNSALEVRRFKDTYQLMFPVFADDDAFLHHKFGDVKFPYYIGVKISADEPARIIYSRLGQIRDFDAFVQLLLHRSEDIEK